MRDAADLRAFEHQLDRIAAGGADHLVISGDLLDRWRPRLLVDALNALSARGLLAPARASIIHGNHDLTSSGAHPRSRADLPRLLFRAWDPPPLVAARHRRFYAAIHRRAPGVAARAPFSKDLDTVTIATIDTVSVPWIPFRVRAAGVQLRHAAGCVRGAELESLTRSLPPGKPVVLVMHHYPLPVAPYRWPNAKVDVLMEIPAGDRKKLWAAAHALGVRLVLCGHIHRARLEWHEGIAVGLQGQSGAGWAGRPIAWYQVPDNGSVTMTLETTSLR
jgi:3',5'-cyclic AMP phosphodiesterase CpdA